MQLRTILAACFAATLYSDSVARDAPRCALLDPDKVDRVALLEAKLTADASSTWVERNAVDQVLKEQQVQTLFGAKAVGERARLGKLLKADVLVMVRRVKGAKESALEVVVCETAGGMRLLVSAVPVRADAAADAEALRVAVAEGLKKHGETVTEVVTAPAFVSHNLTFESDHLKGALAKLVERVALGRPGTVTVELDEAEALAKEAALATGGGAEERPLPLYVLGEFRHEGRGAERTATVTLRAERGGKPVGKPATLVVKPTDVPEAVRAWAAETIQAAAGDKAARPPADPKEEAKRLYELAATHRRMGNWAEALPLLEAALLLDPAFDAADADALDVIRHLIEDIVQSTARLKTDRLPELDRLQWRGFEHAEAVLDRGAYHDQGMSPRMRQFLATLFTFAVNLTGPLANADREWRPRRREVLFRMFPKVAMEGHLEEMQLLSGLYYKVSVKERYALIEQALATVLDLPRGKERIIYIARGAIGGIPAEPPASREEEAEAFRSFLTSLEKSPNAEYRETAAVLKKSVSVSTTPSPTTPRDPNVKIDTRPAGLKGVALHPITFAPLKGGHDPYKMKWVRAAGAGVDYFWGDAPQLWKMTEKGRIRRLEAFDRFGANVVEAEFDGRHLWVTGRRGAGKGGPLLLVIDPLTDKIREVTADDGLPVPSTEQVSTQWLNPPKIGAVETGRIGLAGEYGGRAWVAVARIDPQGEKVEVKILHEARQSGEKPSEEQARNTTTSFRPSYVRAIAGKTGSGAASARLLVGRGSLNEFMSSHPLSVDPDTGKVETLNDPIRPKGSHSRLDNLLILSDRANICLVQMEKRLTGPHSAGKFFHLTLPNLAPLQVGQELVDGNLRDAIMHGGDYYFLYDIDQPRKEEFRPGQPDWKYELWAADAAGKTLPRRIGTGLPPAEFRGVSSHYGVVLAPFGRNVLQALEVLDDRKSP